MFTSDNKTISTIRKYHWTFPQIVGSIRSVLLDGDVLKVDCQQRSRTVSGDFFVFFVQSNQH